MQATFFEDGPITVDNDSHPEFTVVNVLVALEIEGALLKVTSALTNSGCSIQKGEINVGLSLPFFSISSTKSNPVFDRKRNLSLISTWYKYLKLLLFRNRTCRLNVSHSLISQIAWSKPFGQVLEYLLCLI